MIKVKYFIFFAISISILSLIVSIFVFTKNNNVGRYQVFNCEGFVYIIDTKTSRLFIRTLFPHEGKGISLDFGTLDKPLYENNVFNLQTRDSFVPDKPQGDIFDEIAPDN